MFAKLLKYEWKSGAGILGILSLAALGAGLLGTVVMRLMIASLNKMAYQDDEASTVLGAVLASTLVFLVLALLAYGVAVQILLLVRFYRNKFTDEGYLTFTLPVNSHQIFLSSLVNYLVWTVIAGCTIGLAVMMAVFFGTAEEGLINYEAVEGLQRMVQLYWESIVSIYDGYNRIFQVILQWIVGLVYSPVLVLTCITVGASIAQRHKILASFGIYYGVSMVVSIITSVLSGVIMVTTISGTSLVSPDWGYWAQIAVQAVITVGCYFLSTYLMKHKLNLP